MTINEAKIKVASEFISKYKGFLNDLKTLSENEIGHKYGYLFSKDLKDTQKTMLIFQRKVFSGRYLPAWERAGIDRNTVWELHRIGFFSHDLSQSWMAHKTGKTDFYYINQAKAKEIYKAYKNGFFNK